MQRFSINLLTHPVTIYVQNIYNLENKNVLYLMSTVTTILKGN